MKVEVYSRKEDKVAGIPACVQCKMTEQRLEAAGIEFEVIDVEKDPEAKQKLADLGVRQVPAVFVDGDLERFGKSWVGFLPDNIKKLADEIEAQKALGEPGL